MADTIGTIGAIWAFSGPGTAVSRSAGTLYTFTVAILTSCYRIAIAVVDTTTEVIRVKAFVVCIAKPFSWTLLVEVAGCRWRAA